jgi:hypothetical protein
MVAPGLRPEVASLNSASYVGVRFHRTSLEFLAEIFAQCRRGGQTEQRSNMLLLQSASGQRLHQADLSCSGFRDFEGPD